MNDYVRSMRSRIGHDTLIMVGVGVFVVKGEKILLQKREDNGLWADHGGALEIGETLEETGKRELFEETGLTARTLEFIGTYTGKEMFFTYPNGDKAYIVGNYFICSDYSGEICADPAEVAELKWFGVGELPPDTVISPPSLAPLKKCAGIIRERNAKR
ncbi:MAG: NUDIX domain-containing protein [Eubacteriales bacterium]|nr:NUDIX domain-containing protein [Eubacteriales bacterium]MDD3882666.1 NUDIX domain-containing protein [Eubacteriales bacterium]MDD4512762.1 NUDIX domain-containing protein [Eubacteriales bacterium]